jgi:hypothetical protein
LLPISWLDHLHRIFYTLPLFQNIICLNNNIVSYLFF